MARAYSSQYKSTLAGTSAPEAPLTLLEITHPGMTEPARVVDDTQDFTFQGDLYIACGFRIVPPDDFESQSPRSQLAIDNVGRELMQWIEASGGGRGASVRFIQAMRSRPELVEWEVTMQISNTHADVMEVSSDLGFEDFYGRAAVALRYDQITAPGQF